MGQTANKPLPEGRIWFVRAEAGNALAELFVEQGVVSMGWGIGPLQPGESRPEIIRCLTANCPDEKEGTIRAWASNIQRFNQQMTVGDAVATYDSQQRVCHIGVISALLIDVELIDLPPEYSDDHDYAHRVEWLYAVSRDDLSGPAWRGLVNPQTLFLLSESTSAELRGLCAPGN